eukprot:4672043-Prymnesium_polylepis.1
MAKLVPEDAALYADSHPVARRTLAAALRAEARSPRVGRWVHAVKEGCQLLAITECFASGSHKGSCTLPHPKKQT